jgi:molecular chaperone GrpE
MNPEIETTKPEDTEEIFAADDSPTINADESQSVEDFIKELEAKEKDLHITADYKIEISDVDFDFAIVPDFVQEELPAAIPMPSAVPAPANGSKTLVHELQQEVESLKQKLAALRMERDDVQKKSDLRLKDFESFKYRMDRERRGAFISQVGNITTQLLPVIDNLDRALDSISSVSEKKRNEFKQFIDGVGLVNQQINEVLAGMGVEAIATVGESFDPNFHEAVVTEESTELPPNTICGEMLRGYRIGNLVIRHSMVKVTIPPAPLPKNKKKGEPKESPNLETIAEPTDLLPDNPPHDAE